MNLSQVGDVIGVIGELMVAWMAIAVHHRVRHEHKIDKKVFKIMRKERTLGFIGMSLILGGLILRLVF